MSNIEEAQEINLDQQDILESIPDQYKSIRIIKKEKPRYKDVHSIDNKLLNKEHYLKK